MKTWITLTRTLILNHSKWLQVENHTIRLPDGKILSEWPWIISPDFVNVFAVTTEDKVLCFRQPKYAIKGIGIAPVGGYLESGEDPLAAAKRELLEETGFESAQWKHLGSFVVDGNHGAGNAHLYLALEAMKTSEPSGGDLEEQELLFLTTNELDDVLRSGEIKVISWDAGAAMALMELKRDQGESFQ